MKKKILFCAVVFFSAVLFCVSANDTPADRSPERMSLSAVEEIAIFRQAYPFAKFGFEYDDAMGDWKLTVTSYGKTRVLYYCDGLYLPKDQIANRAHYRPVIYNYRRILQDPSTFTEEQKARIRNFGSDENRKNGAVSSKFIFDAIYDCYTRTAAESHLRHMTLWDKPVSMNREVGRVLDRVEAKVWQLAKTDKSVAEFLRAFYICYGYNWRQIRDSPTKSFHSYGIAVDVLPRGWGKKIIYWGYEKQKGNDDWMLIPLKDRWLPPAAVVKAFEDEGFIWGGRWAVWDNMHFEYHPELLLASKVFAQKTQAQVTKQDAEQESAQAN